MTITQASIFLDKVMDDCPVKRECAIHLERAADILRDEDLKRRRQDVHDD